MQKDCATNTTFKDTESSKNGSGQCEDCEHFFMCHMPSRCYDPESGLIDMHSSFTINCLRNNYAYYKYRPGGWKKNEEDLREWWKDAIEICAIFALFVGASIIFVLFISHLRH